MTIGVKLMNKSYPIDQLNTYSPLNDPVYMSEDMLDYFRNKLIVLRNHLCNKDEISSVMVDIIEDTTQVQDFIEQGHTEELHQRKFLFQRHENKLLREINDALLRIEDGSYGYCDETGDRIGVKRLEAVPQARYCVNIQQQKENAYKYKIYARGAYGAAI